MFKTWNVSVEQVNYEIKANYNTFLGKLNLTVNGESKVVRPLFWSQITGFDVPIQLGQKKVILQVVGRKMDLAVEGYFLGSKEEYKPFIKIPLWNWFFIIFTLIIPIIMPGAVPMILALVTAMYIIRVSTSPKLLTPWKLIIIFMTVLFEWLLFGILIMFTSS